MDKTLKAFIEKLRKIPENKHIAFAILYGSRAEKRHHKNSDYDIALYYTGPERKDLNFLIRLKNKFPEQFDIHMFQDLPLYIQKEVLKGKLLYTKDEALVYDVAYETIKKFNDFKKYYESIIEVSS